MCDKKIDSTLFDRFIKEIDDETSIRDSRFQQDEVVSYTSNRTGCEAHMSAARYMAITSLASGLRKKYIGPSIEGSVVSEEERKLRCARDFIARNQQCELFNLTYDPLTLDPFIGLVRGEVKAVLADCLDDLHGSVLNLSEIAHRLRAGPGASAHVRSDAGTFPRYMNGAMSFSNEEVYLVYRACTHISPLTHCAEAVRRENWGSDDFLDAHAVFLSVHKNSTKNRAICKQPSGNMLLQLATHSILCDVLQESFDCNLEDQQFKNRALAFLGSMQRISCKKDSYEFCTADLTSASDYPLVLTEDMYPENWSVWLKGIRSSYMDVEGVPVQKHILSSMGNGFTFANMTLFLSAIVKVLYRLANIPEYDVTELLFDGQEICPFKKSDSTERVPFKTWGVYGDDIIVDRRVWNPLIKVLTAFGFIVNENKSFCKGPFRESCGGDYYLGYNVRPVFCKDLQTQADVYSLLNRLISWGVYHSWDLPRSIAILRSALVDELRVPNWEDVCAGFHVPEAFSKTKALSTVPLPLRHAEIYDLERSQRKLRFYDALTPVAKCKCVFFEKKKEIRFHFCDVVTHKEYSWVAPSVVSVRFKKYYRQNHEIKPNYYGILASMIEGSIRGGRYGVRSNSTSFIKTTKVAPYWGDLNLSSSTAVLSKREDTRSSPYRLWEEYIARCCFRSCLN